MYLLAYKIHKSFGFDIFHNGLIPTTGRKTHYLCNRSFSQKGHHFNFSKICCQKRWAWIKQLWWEQKIACCWCWCNLGGWIWSSQHWQTFQRIPFCYTGRNLDYPFSDMTLANHVPYLRLFISSHTLSWLLIAIELCNHHQHHTLLNAIVSSFFDIIIFSSSQTWQVF